MSRTCRQTKALFGKAVSRDAKPLALNCTRWNTPEFIAIAAEATERLRIEIGESSTSRVPQIQDVPARWSG